MSYAAIRAAVWAILVLGICGLAVRRGGREERMAAGVMLAGWLLTLALYRYRLQGTEWGVLFVDVAALVAFIWIAVRSRRYWPLLAAGFHLLAVVTHIARTVDVHLNHWAYITAEIIWGYLVAFAVAYGVWTSPRNQTANAPVPTPTPGATRR